MNTSGDAAEQIVRLSLEGFEVIARLTGSGAKEALAMMYAVLKDNEQQSIGKTNLINMLRTCKNIKIFSMPKKDLDKFVKASKKYGILYCTLLDKNSKSEDAIVDIMVRGEDAARVDRIVQRYQLSISDTAELRKEKEKEIDKTEEKAEIEKEDIQISDDIVDDILGDNKSETIEEIKSLEEIKDLEEIEGLEVLTEQDVIEIMREEDGVSNDFLEEENQLEHFWKNKDGKNSGKIDVKKTINNIKTKVINSKEEIMKELEIKQDNKSKNKNEKNKNEKNKNGKNKNGKNKKGKSKNKKGAKKNVRAR